MSVSNFLISNVMVNGTIQPSDISNSEKLYNFLNEGRVNSYEDGINFDNFLNEDEKATIKITDDLSPMNDEEDEDGNTIEVVYNWVSPDEYLKVLIKLKAALFTYLTQVFKQYEPKAEPNENASNNFYKNHFALIYKLATIEEHLNYANSINSKIAFTVSDY
jgi:hypothetical protein